MPLTAITIIGTFEGPSPTQTAEGTVSFKLNQALFLPGIAIVQPRNYTVALDGNGSIPAGTQLFATDDVGTEPYGQVYYRAILRLTGAATEIRYFFLPHGVGTFDLSDLSTLSSVPPTPPTGPTSIHTMTWQQADAATWPDADTFSWQAA